MKPHLLFSVLLALTGWTSAQGSDSIDNIEVSQRSGDEERVVDIQFDLVAGSYSEYTISLKVSFDDRETFTPIAPNEVIEGELTVEPATGIQLVWDGRISFSHEYANNARIKILAEPARYDLNLNVEPENSGQVEGEGDFKESEQITIEATPEEGWEFVNWTDDDDGDAVVSTDESYTLDMPADNVNLTANYEMIDYTLTLIAKPDVGGSVEDVTADAPYNIGDEVAIKAEANERWEFTEWTGNNASYLDDVSAAEATLTMPSENVKLAANFQAKIVYGDGVTDIDGNDYVTVKIGNQEWMAENLRVTKYNNGATIPTGLSNTDWSGTTSGTYAIYPFNDLNADGIDSPEEMVAAYGKLYNWYAVDDERGLCPEGWSVPSDDDWTQLIGYVVSQGYPNKSTNPNGAGNALKSCRQVGHDDDNCNTSDHPRWLSDGTHSGFDEFGFSALPGGFRRSSGGFLWIGLLGHWWSATNGSGSNAWNRSMYTYYGHVVHLNSNKTFGFSVRCMRNLD